LAIARAAGEALVRIEHQPVREEIHLQEHEELVHAYAVRGRVLPDDLVLRPLSVLPGLILDRRGVPDAEARAARAARRQLPVDPMGGSGQGNEVEIVEDVVGVDLRKGRALSARGEVRVAVAALGALANHEIGLGSGTVPTEHEGTDEPDQNGNQLFCAHWLIHVWSAVISSLVKQTPCCGTPGQPIGICDWTRPGPPSTFVSR